MDFWPYNFDPADPDSCFGHEVGIYIVLLAAAISGMILRFACPD